MSPRTRDNHVSRTSGQNFSRHAATDSGFLPPPQQTLSHERPVTRPQPNPGELVVVSGLLLALSVIFGTEANQLPFQPLHVFPVYLAVVPPAPARLPSVTCAEVVECSLLPVSGASGTSRPT